LDDFAFKKLTNEEDAFKAELRAKFKGLRELKRNVVQLKAEYEQAKKSLQKNSESEELIELKANAKDRFKEAHGLYAEAAAPFWQFLPEAPSTPEQMAPPIAPPATETGQRRRRR
jgi:hypothetical protein